MNSCDSISTLTVVGNCFSDVGDVVSRLRLYSSLSFDSVAGTPDGIQLTFAHHLVASIYTNGGTPHNSWPIDSGTIKINDSIPAVGAALSALALQARYYHLLQRFTLSQKDCSTEADSIMFTRSEWYFGRTIAPDTVLVTHLFFADKLLDSIWCEKVRLVPMPY